jgi:hypothetical protein
MRVRLELVKVMKDLDIWIEPTPEIAARALDALRKSGCGPTEGPIAGPAIAGRESTAPGRSAYPLTHRCGRHK